jgi:superkiller protein 3
LDSQKKSDLYDRAIEQFEKAIALKPDFGPGYAMLGLIHNKQGKFDEAIRDYQSAVRLNTSKSSRAQNYENMAQIYVSLTRYDEAVRYIKDAIELDPKRPSFYETLALIRISQGDVPATFDSLKQASELRANVDLEAEANSDPYYFLGAAYAIRFMQKGIESDFKEAVQWLAKAINLNAGEATYYKALGTTFEKHKGFDEAMTNYKKAIEFDPKNPDHYFDLAGIYATQGNYDAAVETVNKVIEITPKSAQAFQYLGMMYHRKNNDTEAVKAELRSIELNEKYMPAYMDLGEIYRTQKNYSQALKYLEGAVRVAPTDFHPYKERAKLFEAMAQPENAIQEYERAISFLGPVQEFPRRLYLCRIERLRSKYGEAIACFQKLTGTPSDADTILFDIGATQVAANNKTAAVAIHEQLKQMKSALAPDLWNLISNMK